MARGLGNYRLQAQRGENGIKYRMIETIGRDDAEDDLFLLFMALNAAPYTDRVELVLLADPVHENADLFKELQETLMQGHAPLRFDSELAAPLVKMFAKSPLVERTSLSFYPSQAGEPVTDVAKADRFSIVYYFTLKERPVLH